jgi:hypothetical protein
VDHHGPQDAGPRFTGSYPGMGGPVRDGLSCIIRR